MDKDESAASAAPVMGLRTVGVDVFEAQKGETVKVAIQAIQVPYNVSFGDLPPSTNWRVVQRPSPIQPSELREFTMPDEHLHFEIVYRFPSDVRPGAHYSRAISGSGHTNGPFDIPPLPYFQTVTLSYVFDPAK